MNLLKYNIMKVKAIWNGKVIASTDKPVNVEGNYYFPPDSINMEYFRKSEIQTVCHWKGTASYYDVIVDNKVNKDAAWYYPAPSGMASNIKNHIAFWKGIIIEKEN